MVRNLEERAQTRFVPELQNTERVNSNPELIASYIQQIGRTNPEFVNALKGLPKERQAEIYGALARYSSDLANSPQTRRMISLGEMHDQLPEDHKDEDDLRSTLRQRVYDMPGRHYPYINAVSGTGKAGELRAQVGKALKYTVKDGWPGLLAGGGWLLANNWYKTQAAKGLVKRAASAFSGNLLDYVPIFGKRNMLVDAGKVAAGEGALTAWSTVSTPLMYILGAYSAYKAIKSVLKARRETKLENREKLEEASRNLTMQRQALANQMAFAA